MEIVEEKTGEVLALAIKGRLDALSSKEAEKTILGKIEAGETRLLIDMSELDYVSSIGLRVLMLTAKRLKRVDGKLAMCALKPSIQKVFDIAGFSAIFTIKPTRQEGIEALG